MKKLSFRQKIIALIFTGLIVILLGLLMFPDKIWQINPSKEMVGSFETLGEKVSLTIDDGQGTPKIFLADFQEKMTAFDLLKEKTEESGLTLKTKSYDIGTLIEVIGDKENGKDGKYWLYYVNGQMPPLSADKKELQPGDKVKFKFENSPF